MNAHTLLVFIAGLATGIGICRWPDKATVALCVAVAAIALVAVGVLP